MVILREPDAANFVSLIPLAYTIPTILLYLLILYVIFLSRVRNKFRGSFYILFGVQAIYCLINNIVYYLHTRFLSAPIYLHIINSFAARGFLITLWLCLIYHSAVGIILLNLCISFNRFSVIWLKVNYNNFWRIHLKWFLLFVILVPFFFHWYVWLTDVALLPVNAANLSIGYTLDRRNKGAVPWMASGRNMMILFGLTTIPSLIMNLYVSDRLLRQRFGKMNRVKEQPHNVRLFIFNVFNFLVEVAGWVLQILFEFNSNAAFQWSLFTYQVYYNDIMTLAPAWFLFLLSNNLRRETAVVLLRVNMVVVTPITSYAHSQTVDPVSRRRT